MKTPTAPTTRFASQGRPAGGGGPGGLQGIGAGRLAGDVVWLSQPCGSLGFLDVCRRFWTFSAWVSVFHPPTLKLVFGLLVGLVGVLTAIPPYIGTPDVLLHGCRWETSFPFWLIVV